VLGCGVVHTEVLSKCGLEERHGWAFGLGLERLAMVLFKIPDIRLFWSNDSRFTKQFAKGEVTTFKPYSKYPPCYKDIAFWLPEDGSFVANDFFELARGIGGDLIEQIEGTIGNSIRVLCSRFVFCRCCIANAAYLIITLVSSTVYAGFETCFCHLALSATYDCCFISLRNRLVHAPEDKQAVQLLPRDLPVDGAVPHRRRNQRAAGHAPGRRSWQT
jgi:hypothetical protein